MQSQNEGHFADDMFLNENYCILCLKFHWICSQGPKNLGNNIQALAQIMAWCHEPGDKPLSEPMMAQFTEGI